VPQKKPVKKGTSLMKSHWFAWLTCVCVGVVALIGGGMASADPILPGFDMFSTPPGGASVDLGMGPIPLMGIPLPNMAPGPVDTIVARMDPGPPPGGTATIDIELVALHLRSIVPGSFMGGDLHITVDQSARFVTGTPATGVHPRPAGNGMGPSLFNLPSLPPPSTGNMILIHEAPGPTHSGADMAACFGTPGGCPAGLGVPGGGVYATATVTIPGGDPSNPADILPGGGPMPAPPVTLSSTGHYLHTLVNRRMNGGIILGPIIHVGPHPNTIPADPLTGFENTVPEPGSALLVLCAVFGCGLVRRRNC
jgi:hypothetical protein